MLSEPPVERRMAASYPRHATHRYSIYGLTLESDIAIPTALDVSRGEAADVVIRRVEGGVAKPDGEPVIAVPCPTHGVDAVQYRSARGTWIWYQAIGTVHISPDFHRVDVYPLPTVDERLLGVTLGGSTILFIRHMLGKPGLHASAVVIDGGAVGFLGESGQGKSTIAASFLRRGAALLTDDALGLRTEHDTVYGEPGPAFMKVWPETVEHGLAIDDVLPELAVNQEKKLLDVAPRFGTMGRDVLIRHLYLLERYDAEGAGRNDVVIEPLSGNAAVLALLSHTAIRLFLLPTDTAGAFRVFSRLARQAAVNVLRYPSGYHFQDTVCRAIVDDLCVT